MQRTIRPLLRTQQQRWKVCRYLSQSHDAAAQHEAFQAQMAELAQEREDLFGFTAEDRTAWTNPTSNPMMETIHQTRELAQSMQDTTTNVLTHVSSDGQSISMVDVGDKAVTKRTATAISKVLFPPEVMAAFEMSSNDLIGPKGPIFATAKITGIMAAKRCSDLIPLCHPLPLDNVHIDITVYDNVATIACTCRVTHKTGVEMEALTGATVAALTIYDMCKAVSHEISIVETKLVRKHGGKRQITPDNENE